MKKAISILLTAAIALSFSACGAKSDAPTPPVTSSASVSASTSTSAPTSSKPVASGASGTSSTSSASSVSSAPVVPEDTTAAFPLSYTPATKAGDAMKQIFGGQEYYKADSEVTIEYCQAQDDLYTARNGKSSWPEFNDEWKSYGYSNIVNKGGVSARTFATGLYGERHATVIKENQGKLTALGEIKIINEPKAPEGKILVPYSKLEITGAATIETVADVAQQALYLQAWLLVPAKSQGVLVTANGMDMTTDMILEELAK